MSWQITTQPTAEPVALDDVKARLKLTSTADDVTLTSQITQAREFCERISGRSLAAKSYAFFMDQFPFPRHPIRLPFAPLLAVTAIKFVDDTLSQQTWDPSEYWVAANQDPGLIVPVPNVVYPWPAPVPGAVEVDFNAGGLCPADWQRVVQNVAMFIYANPAERIPETLVQIPKLWTF